MRKARILLMTATILATIVVPARATFPGENGLIVFAGSKVETESDDPLVSSYCGYVNPFDLYTMEPDGSGISNLTKSEGIEWEPVWSPDGRRIAFSYAEEDSEIAELRVMDVGGSGVRTLATSESSAIHPSWSDHGFWVAYGVHETRETDEGFTVDQDIYRVRSDGSRSEPVMTTEMSEMMPAYSPDGRLIAFVGGHDIWTVEPDGSRPRQLTERLTFRRRRPRAYGGISSLGWSPDGRFILFAMNRGEGDTYIYRLRRGGGGLKKLALGTDPSWAPNGKTIIYQAGSGEHGSYKGCTLELFKMGPDGSHKRQLKKRDDMEMSRMDWQSR